MLPVPSPPSPCVHPIPGCDHHRVPTPTLSLQFFIVLLIILLAELILLILFFVYMDKVGLTGREEYVGWQWAGVRTSQRRSMDREYL